MTTLYTPTVVRQIVRISSNEINDTDLTVIIAAATSKFEQLLLSNDLVYTELETTEQDAFKPWVLHEICQMMNDRERYKNAYYLKMEIEKSIRSKGSNNSEYDIGDISEVD